MQVLLEARSRVDSCNQDGETPLCYASKEGHFEVARLLLDANACPRTADEDGR